MTAGTDLVLTVGDTRPPTPGTDVVSLDNSKVWLLKFAAGLQQGVTVNADAFTLYLPEGAASGTSWALQLIADDVAWDEITGVTLPDLTGPVATTGVLGAVAAGGSVVFNVQPQYQGIASGVYDDLGVRIVRLDAGAAVKVGTFRSDTYPPLHAPVIAQVLPQPTRPSPTGGRAVSATKVLLRLKGYVAGLGDIGVAAMQVSWYASLANALAQTSALATDTLATAAAEFDMTKTQRIVDDGHVTSGSNLITSAAANFSSLDIGTKVSGAGIPGGFTGSTITAWNPLTGAITIASPATATGTTVHLVIGSGFALSSTHRWWRGKVQSTDGSWSPPSDPAETYVAGLGTLTFPIPPVDPDPDPLRTATLTGATIESYQITRSPNAVPALVVGDSGIIEAATIATHVGYEVLDDSSYTDTIVVYDTVDREDIPGAPAYVTATGTWSAGNDTGLAPPENVSFTQVGTGPFVTARWTHPGLVDFRMRVGAPDGPENLKNVSGLLQGADVTIGFTDDGDYLYEWTWFGATPNTLLKGRMQAVTNNRGSTRSDPVLFQTTTTGDWIACQATGDYAPVYNVPDSCKWILAHPGSVAYWPVDGDFRAKIIREGARQGYTMNFEGDLYSDADHSVNYYHLAINRMELSLEDLVYVRPHETVTVRIYGDMEKTPIDNMYADNDLPRHIALNLAQTGDSTLSGNDFDSPGQGEVITYDYEEGS